MPRIFEPGSGGRVRFTSVDDSRFWEYANKESLAILKKAFWIIKTNVRGLRPCNDCFARLPGGRTFTEVWDDNSVWINHEPRADVDFFGATIRTSLIVTVSQRAFNMGTWFVVSTLVHELAHINGATGSTSDAEDTLPPCGLKGGYRASAFG
jgi:hypothetical protein